MAPFARRPDGDGIAGRGAALFLLVLASASGLVAANWEEEVAVSYAPPTFVGADKDAAAAGDGAIPWPTSAARPPSTCSIRWPTILPNCAELARSVRRRRYVRRDDPLADDLTALRAGMGKAKKLVTHKAATLPFGADKWGHDILQKTIKGGETSIVVGLVAALLAVAGHALAPCPATSAAWSMTSSTGSTASSRRFRPS
jgi:peptide/nickel transport system permease protein